jgi:hypothetical protein
MKIKKTVKIREKSDRKTKPQKTGENKQKKKT